MDESLHRDVVGGGDVNVFAQIYRACAQINELPEVPWNPRMDYLAPSKRLSQDKMEFYLVVPGLLVSHLVVHCGVYDRAI